MKDNYINLIEVTPKLHSKKCKLFSLLLRCFLQYSIFVLAILTWYFYDYFMGGAVFLLSFIVLGIIRSKIRNSVIPLEQREYQYNDQAIADWYVAKEICFEEELKD
ncbi:MAG: hypothetical protein COB42_03040 [Sulfurimonas sp.]|nr:MAG: hypothetical protein COB42_03040 [Sulfurimonas sp.]